MPSRTVSVENGRLFHDGELRERDLIADAETGRVLELSSDVDDLRGREHTTVDADGALVLPGGVDAHVHFREPGASHKEDWRTGSRSAAAGGVTAVVDQPNTSPPTVDARSFEEKRELASKSLVDYGINAGVTPDWKPDELAELPVTAYGEVFMADSTGEMGIRTDLFSEALETLSGREALVTVHAEDSSEFVDVDGDDPDAWSRHRPPQSESKAVETAVEVADRHDARLHFAHVSHPDSVELIHATRHTCEVT
ncbi:MAG: amidohydrolase family protein, partial [Halobacteria archaeon]|nr:amidohydrolase family protein [Halobacteria archaeon]